MRDSKFVVTNIGKFFRSKSYNFDFDKRNGFFSRWGAKVEDNPDFAPFPEIADIEITTACTAMCPWCYKANTPNGKYMSLETFKKLLDKLPHVTNKDGKKHWFLTQIAFGLDATCKTNPDTFEIFEYCRQNDIIPNLTVADIDDETAQKIAKYAGACAVSRYFDKNKCYNSIDLLTNKYGMNQVNIHMLVSQATLKNLWETLKDIKTDPRLRKLNAIVFLSLKKKGRGVNAEPVPQEEFTRIIQYCLENNIPWGSDSCGAHRVMKSFNPEQTTKYKDVIEDCESTRMSMYCDVNGRFFPCSFIANENFDGWDKGIDLLTITDFAKDVWYHPSTVAFRNRVLECNKKCGSCCHFTI